MPSPDLFTRYNFNPYQFTGPDWWMRDAHRRNVPFFQGCKLVLDLGAGRGFFLEELRAAGIEGLGVESHEASIREGEAKGLKFSPMDIFEFFKSEEGRKIAAQADGVYCAHVIEHLDPEGVFELFRNVRTYCAPRVRARFITNNPADITVLGHVFWGDLTHRRLYPGELLVGMAKSQGFTNACSEVYLGLKLGKRDRLRRLWDRLFWGPHKWKPNLRVDCT